MSELENESKLTSYAANPLPSDQAFVLLLVSVSAAIPARKNPQLGDQIAERVYLRDCHYTGFPVTANNKQSAHR